MSDTQVRDEMLGLSGEGDPIASFARGVLDVLVDRSRRSSAPLRGELVISLADGILNRDDMQLEAALRVFRRACITPAAMAEIYVPAAARRLGSDWERDLLGFADVTIGVARLQSLVRAIGTRWGGDAKPIAAQHTILMIVPEQHDHTLGAVVATGQLRRMGLSVCLRLGPNRREVVNLLRTRDFGGAMISIGNADRLDVARRLVETIRAFGPRGMPVIAGGAIPFEREELTRLTRVDFVTNDLDLAVARCGSSSVPATGSETRVGAVLQYE